ncbi:MAG: YIP1 family protein [Firmicutes bacterium]|nr:YIP1 family protein [Bacillota bacterium]
MVASGKTPWITILSNPTQFFATRRERLGWVWIMVAYSVTAALAVLAELPEALKSPQYVKEMAAATAKNPAMGGIIKTSAEVGGPVGALLSVWITLFVGAFVLWILTKLFGVAVRYMQVVRVIANASIIAIIDLVVGVIVSLATGTLTKSFLTLGMISSTGHLGGLLAGIGVFSLWAVYIEIVGVAELGQVSKGRASGPVVLMFVLVLLLQMAVA